MSKVLIIGGESVQTLIVAPSLKKNGYLVDVVCDGTDNYGYHTKYASKHIVAPHCKHEREFMDFFLPFLRENSYDVVIPMDDDSALICSKYKSEIVKFSNVLMPDINVFLEGFDKNKLMSLCERKGYPHPKTVDMRLCCPNGKFSQETYLKLKDFPWPGLLKPNITSGGRGMIKINSVAELEEVYPRILAEYGECHFQQYIESGGKQVKVQVFVDNDGTMKYASAMWKQRYYPINGGSSCCNVTIDAPEIVEVCKSVLRDIKWVGFADFDLIENPATNELLIMEINPRLPACVKSAFKSGLDYATMIADATLHKKVKAYEYKSGITLRHLGLDVLWFLKSSKRFTSQPCWFNFLGKNICYQDLNIKDPLPFIFGTWGNIKKQFDPNFRKAKSGLNMEKQNNIYSHRGGVINPFIFCGLTLKVA